MATSDTQLNAVRVGQLLELSLDPKGQTQAYAEFKAFSGPDTPIEHQREFAALLAAHIFENPSPGIRQLACVLLRRRIPRTWPSMTPADQSALWSHLQSALTTEQDNPARAALAHLMGAVGRLDFSPVLMDYVAQSLVESPHPHLREAGQRIVGSLVDSCPDKLQPFWPAVMHLLARGMADTDLPSVVEISLESLADAVPAVGLELQTQLLTPMVDPLLITLARAAQNNIEPIIQGVLRVLIALVETTVAISSNAAPQVLSSVLQHVCASSSPQLGLGTREMGFHFIQEISERQPAVFYKNLPMLDSLLSAFLQLASRPDSDLGEDGEPVNDLSDDGSGDLSLLRQCLRCLDTLAINLPSSALLSSLMPKLGTLAQSQNVYERRAAFMCLAILCEGCEDQLRQKVPELMPLFLAALVDDHEIIRIAAGIGLGQMAEFLQPEVLQHTNQVLDVAGQAFVNCVDARRAATTPAAAAAIDQVLDKLLYALEVFGSNAEEAQMAAHQAALVPAIVRCMQLSDSVRLKKACVVCLSSVAQTAKASFQPYLEYCLTLVTDMFSTARNNEPGIHGIRSKGVHLAARLVANPRASDATRQQVIDLVMTVLQQLPVQPVKTPAGADTEVPIDEFEDMRGSAFYFFQILAFVVRDDFAPLLSKLLPCIFATCLNSELVIDDEDDGEKEEEEESLSSSIHVHTGKLEELVAAVQCLQALTIAVPTAANSYEQTLQVCQLLSQHFYPPVREGIADLVEAVMFAVAAAQPPVWYQSIVQQPSYDDTESVWTAPVTRGWQPGFPVTRSSLGVHLHGLWTGVAWPILGEMVATDSDPSVVSEACRNVADLLTALGPALLTESDGTLSDDVADVIRSAVASVFAAEHPCQDGYQTADLDEDVETRQREEQLFEGVSLLLGAFAEAGGAQVALQMFDAFHPQLLKLVQHRRSAPLRSNGLGAYCDAIKTVAAARAENPAAEVLLQKYILAVAPCLAGSIHQEGFAMLRQNAAYCAALLIQTAPTAAPVVAQLQAIWTATEQTLRGYLEHQPAGVGLSAMDNLASLAGAMLLSLPPALLGPASSRDMQGGRGPGWPYLELESLVPLFSQAMPLKRDFVESGNCAKALIKVIREAPRDVVVKLFPAVAQGTVLLLASSRCAAWLEKVESRSLPGKSLHAELAFALVHLLNVLAGATGLAIEDPTKVPSALREHSAVQHLCQTVAHSPSARAIISELFPN